MLRRKHSYFENPKRDEHSSKDEPKRAETDRERSLQRREKVTGFPAQVAGLIFYFSGVVKINVHEPLPADADLASPDDDDDDDAAGPPGSARRRTPKCD